MPHYEPLVLEYPFWGRWQVRNSPANRIPSHGTTRFGLSYAIDFVPVDEHGRSAPVTMRSLFCTESPAAFTGFGRPIHSPVDGVVVAAHDAQDDHRAYRGFPSVGYALTQRRRLEVGWHFVTGNHVLIETPHGAGSAVVALRHLQRGSIDISVGQRLRVGQPVARCGNSGNSTEPHLHLHAVDGRDIVRANAVPIRLGDGLPKNGNIVEPQGR